MGFNSAFKGLNTNLSATEFYAIYMHLPTFCILVQLPYLDGTRISALVGPLGRELLATWTTALKPMTESVWFSS